MHDSYKNTERTTTLIEDIKYQKSLIIQLLIFLITKNSIEK